MRLTGIPCPRRPSRRHRREPIRRAASPIACAPVEQAVTTEWLGPRSLWRIETWPEARLIRRPGMKKGETRRGPLSRSVYALHQRCLPRRRCRSRSARRSGDLVLVRAGGASRHRRAPSSAGSHRIEDEMDRPCAVPSSSIQSSGIKRAVGHHHRTACRHAILAGRSSTSNSVTRRAPLLTRQAGYSTRSTSAPHPKRGYHANSRDYDTSHRAKPHTQNR